MEKGIQVMSLLVNLRHLEKKNLLLTGELPVELLELEGVDELIHVQLPLKYDLEIQKFEKSILAQGSLELSLQCECVRCLKPVPWRLDLSDWACHLPFEGEEKVTIANDCVDLTPYIREDILLSFPQHPLCKPECTGLTSTLQDKLKPGGNGQSQMASSAWTVLDKLKL
ncbi:MAG TPA: YceD family protein [Candidatus Eisenbacteria bacterium]|jgi:uncharacterized protein|nr:YceD family protein [Candidatus Eisenbacteria bacterium]